MVYFRDGVGVVLVFQGCRRVYAVLAGPEDGGENVPSGEGVAQCGERTPTATWPTT